MNCNMKMRDAYCLQKLKIKTRKQTDKACQTHFTFASHFLRLIFLFVCHIHIHIHIKFKTRVKKVKVNRRPK